MQNRKAQIKIQQMAFMLIAVTLFFVLVGLLVFSIAMSNLKGEAETLQEKNSMLLVSKVANSPEFSCGYAFGSGRINCIDEDKVIVLKKFIERNPTDYKNFWGKDINIEIRTIFPKPEKEIFCDQENYPDCNVINLRNKNITAEYSNFVALCRKDIKNQQPYDRCELAKIMVEYK
jgi:hypothetical protein